MKSTTRLVIEKYTAIKIKHPEKCATVIGHEFIKPSLRIRISNLLFRLKKYVGNNRQ